MVLAAGRSRVPGEMGHSSGSVVGEWGCYMGGNNGESTVRGMREISGGGGVSRETVHDNGDSSSWQHIAQLNHTSSSYQSRRISYGGLSFGAAWRVSVGK